MAALTIVKFVSDQIKFVTRVAFSNFQIHMPWSCVNKNFKVPYNFKFLADHQKLSYPIFPHNQHTYTESLLEIGWKLGERLSFENRKIGNFVKCTEWPQTQLKESGIKSTLLMCTVVPRVQNCHPFLLYDQPFSRYCTFYHFLIDSHVKISKCYNFFILGRSPKRL